MIRTPSSRVLRRTADLLVVAAIVAWAVLLRPDALGGSTAYILVSGESMQPTLRSGDLVLVRERATYERGDVIAYRVPEGQPDAGSRVIHRIVGGSGGTGYRTLGDSRGEPDFWRPRPKDVLGRQWVRVPGAASAIRFLSAPLPLAASAGLLTFLLVGRSSPPRARAVA